MNLGRIVAVFFAVMALASTLEAAPAKPDHLDIILTVLPRPTAPAAVVAAPSPSDTAKPDAAAGATESAPTPTPQPTPTGKVEADRVAWVTSCGVLGTTMTVGNGPWGFGAFASYACYIDQKLVGGMKKNSDWTLRMVDDGNGLHVTFEHSPKGKPKKVLNQFHLPAADKPYSYFKDLDLADLTAYTLLDSMPMLMIVNKTEKVGVSAAVSGRKSRMNAKFLIPNPPENMNLFELNYDTAKARFNENSRGTMNFLGYRTAGKEEQTKTIGREEVTPLWAVDEKTEAAITKEALWAHNMAGPGTRQQELNTLVDSAYKFLALGIRPGDASSLLAGKDAEGTDAAFREHFMLGVVSLRLGMSVIREPELLKDAMLIGLVAEVRPKGTKGGLRFYYDLVPKVTADIDDDGLSAKTQLEWSRLALGWAFGLNVQSWSRGVIDSVELTPKLNMWNMKANFETTDQSGETTISNFKLDNDPNLGIEIGVERTISRVLLRGWYGTDVGGFIKKATEKETTVALNRFGLDTWIAGPRWTEKYQMRSSFLAFFLYEQADFVNSKPGGPTEISGMDVQFAYIGVGTGVQW